MASLTTDQAYLNVKLTITDAAGRPAKVDGIPAWASSDETQIAVFPRPDGMTAVINAVAVSPPDTTARVTVSADADLGSGISPLTAVTEDITVTPGSTATTLSLELGDPQDKPVINPL